MSLYSSRVSILFITAISVVVISARDWTQYELLGLAAHNKFRQIHGVPPFELDLEMCDAAQAHAIKLFNAGTLQHTSSDERDGNGENLAFGASTEGVDNGSVTQGVTKWYNEICDPGYNFDNPENNAGTGHITQVVWKSSTKLGIGFAHGAYVKNTAMEAYYLVGRYKPAGNVEGQYAQNVIKGAFESSYCSKIKK